jgi:hypothetical protein
MIDWPEAIELLKTSIVKITTPHGSGTGFVIASANKSNLCGIATAAHVVNNAHYWEEPIRIEHIASGQTFVLRHSDRAVLLEERFDTAAIILERKGSIFQDYNLPVSPEGHSLKLGWEVGWLGFPSVSPNNLCFFTGRISCYIQNDGAYLVDGVAINGVSGGPAFHLADHFPVIIGVVSAYIANRATGETLPGLAVVRDVRQFQELIKRFSSMEEAKQQEAQPMSPPPQPPIPPEQIPPGSAPATNS